MVHGHTAASWTGRSAVGEAVATDRRKRGISIARDLSAIARLTPLPLRFAILCCIRVITIASVHELGRRIGLEHTWHVATLPVHRVHGFVGLALDASGNWNQLEFNLERLLWTVVREAGK
jgi:hypothetical protein